MMELELRFEISAELYHRLEQERDWSPAEQVCDLTLGPTGATSMQTDGFVVRLRRTAGNVRMEYKKPQNADWSAWTEYGTEVGSFSETVKILKALGLQAGLVLDRTRRTARHGHLTLSLDDVRGLGRFLEIEAEVDRAEDESAAAEIAHERELLGLQNHPSARPYGELLLMRLETEPGFREKHERQIAEMLEPE
ncbi:CYTH domain-containing protein [Kribbella sp. NPDC003557]|uniref:CYTH domain-containing protein n=1 Tax=Kribbella sp. NPDC003557 TaxID=3154449 RepID=UPI0033B301EA